MTLHETEVTEDVHLLRYLLEGCKEEIVRLRAKLHELEPSTMKVAGAGILPVRGYSGDAGFDLYVSENLTIAPDSFVDVPCDIRVEIPEGMWAMITGRSSTLRNKGLLVAQGVIDQGYRGELFAGVWNLNRTPVVVKAGDRLAQFIMFPLMSDKVDVVRVLEHEISESDRGNRGFGSTGA